MELEHILVIQCCHGPNLHRNTVHHSEITSHQIDLIQCALQEAIVCSVFGSEAHLLKDPQLCAFWDTFDGAVAYCLLFPSLIHSGVLALAQDLKQAASTSHSHIEG